MGQSFKIYRLDELSSMDHQEISDAYILLASREEELVAQIRKMDADYASLASD